MCMQFNKHCILCVQYCVLNVEIIALDRCISSQKHKAYKQQHRAIELETGKIDQFNASRWIKPSTLRAQQRGPQVSSMHLLPDLTYSIESHQNAAVQSHNFYKTEQKILLLSLFLANLELVANFLSFKLPTMSLLSIYAHSHLDINS